MAETIEGKAKARAEGKIEEKGTPRAKARQATGRKAVASSAATKEELWESRWVEDAKDSAEHAVGLDASRQNVGWESRWRRRRRLRQEEEGEVGGESEDGSFGYVEELQEEGEEEDSSKTC